MIAISTETDRVFILRLSRETELDAKAPEPWRARIIDINTGKSFYANGIEDAFKIVRNQLTIFGDHQ